LISIIICGYNNVLSQKICENIKASCGVVSELLIVDNQKYNLPLTKAYNYGCSNAKFDFLVLVHEDVIFHTQNWGKILLHYFKDLQSPGVLGIAGSSYLPISPSDWWVSDQRYLHTNFLSNSKGGILGEGLLNRLGKKEPKKVFALDGMFLAMKKSVWEEFSFDEDFNGFHGYDTSICYRVSQKYQNYFVPEILIEHFSKGYPNETWLINTAMANQSIHSYIDQIKRSSMIDKELEVKAYHLFLNQLKKFSTSYRYIIFQSWRYLFRNLRHYFHFRLIYLWFSYQLVFIHKLIFK